MRLRDLREDNDWTQSELARILICDQSLYSKFERREREIPLWILINLSFLYDTSLDYIVGLTDCAKLYSRNKESIKLSDDFMREVDNRLM
ncbi:helix-turn-helix transcriptional regulator [Enterococcus hulanensis]|uniref:helix-turn-helix domain-containing protein n=1 Tax=Enterococcus hulanensis TaxID=2559929 RepID=UPI0028916B68|nr:helix-turn-helix transcriptional regulator [Enterococcus hulanensis]MDT2661122.1 helix-turn-helix transcriptional regulator [Enterococcus hulanensis]